MVSVHATIIEKQSGNSSRPICRGFVLSLLLFAIIYVEGCSGGGFAFVPVSGVVTLDGEPLAEAKIIFVPKGDGKNAVSGELSFGVTDQEGRFYLATPSGIDGAIVATHAVAILGEIRDEANPERIIKPEYLPSRYHSGETLFFEVPRDGTDFANFNLVSDSKK